jgi:hypothetical protein
MRGYFKDDAPWLMDTTQVATLRMFVIQATKADLEIIRRNVIRLNEVGHYQIPLQGQTVE